MKLAELVAGEPGLRVWGDVGVEVAGLSYDSRRVRTGDLFFSLARDREQARANIDDALSRGARVVVRNDGDGETARPAVTVVQCERPRRLMGAAASRFFDAPSRRLELVGVTGTSGKTTTAYMLASIFEAAGAPPGIIGTIGIFVGAQKIYSGLTTPESLDFESALAEMERAGVRRVAAEISSIGLAEERVERLSFRACVFTNLGRDHLDYHGTQEKYFDAKLRLFADLLPNSTWPDPVAVVGGDDPFGRRVLDAIKARQIRKVSFGLGRGLDVHPLSYSAGTDGIRASIAALGKRIEVRSPLLGEINLLNILGASAVSVALGIETDVVAEGLRRCLGAPGRLEAVPGPPGVTVLVDYAHKPDALERGAARIARAQAAACGVCLRVRWRSRPRQASIDGRDRGTDGGSRDPHLRQSAQRRSAGDYRGGRGWPAQRGPSPYSAGRRGRCAGVPGRTRSACGDRAWT